MKIRNGIDIIEVNRIEETIEKFGKSFLDKVYTKKEQGYCEKGNMMKYQRYAARFAAKEAIFKAVSEDLTNKNDIKWNQIEVLNNDNGKPIANIDLLNLKEIISMDLSLTHINQYAVASFTIIFED